MSLGEQLFLGLAIGSFSIFGITLAIVAASTESFLRQKANTAAAAAALKKAA